MQNRKNPPAPLLPNDKIENHPGASWPQQVSQTARLLLSMLNWFSNTEHGFSNRILFQLSRFHQRLQPPFQTRVLQHRRVLVVEEEKREGKMGV